MRQNPFMTVRHERGDFVLTDAPGTIDIDVLHEWLSERAYWALGRPRDVVARSVASSRCYTLLEADLPVGFARIITDGATFAWICDVFIDEPARGQGLGHWMMRCIVDDLTRAEIPRMLLATRDAHQIYADVGFQPLEYPERWMEIDRRANRHSLATTEI